MSTKKDILNLLKHEILNLTLKPGTILSETVLSERFQISRTPLRDVLKQLSLESYIDVYPKKGNIVSYIDLESVEQIIYLRSVLEKDIIKGLSGSLTLKGIMELKKNLEEQRNAIHQEHALEHFLTLDDTFHRTLFTLAGHEFLWKLIKFSNVHYERYRRLHMLKQEKLEKILSEHHMILDCMTNHETDKIDELVQHHLREDINSLYLLENFADYIKA
ncbi:GntR family transcriptional regulator [Paenibacillus sp.]|uniref:GntR family transcriptional regulator n=1 Tax=Paenibacillus sp. TaxID=58172 RepID=UPI0028A93413|nr:GntR family transcriptional regulator [Paenibacillus sp.]